MMGVKCNICKWRNAWDCEDYRAVMNTESCKEFELDKSRLTEKELRQYEIIAATLNRRAE